MDDVSAAPRVLSFQLLNEITNGFSNDMKIGAGSYGNVYKGEHKNGQIIAVKVLHSIPGLDNDQFAKEYQNLASLQHKNIVRLVGYSHETQGEFRHHDGRMILVETIKRALCFEYMQNGNLVGFLSDESTGHDWHTRYAIIKGICQGLKCLHEELVPPMYHLDLKPANVLLDENMVPKIADFGLSRLFGGEQTQLTKSAIGTHGYVPPEYIDAGIISIKFDIFSLGMVIIKIITGPKGYFRSAEMSPQQFIELVHRNWKSRLRTTLVHALEPYSEQVKRCLEIALCCVDADRYKRPSIGEIIDKMNETEAVVQLFGTSVNDIGSSTYKVVIDFPSKQAKKQYAGSDDSSEQLVSASSEHVDVEDAIVASLNSDLQWPHTATRIKPGSVQLVIINNKTAPLLEYNKKVLLEVTGGDYTSDRSGLDLVAVVDVNNGRIEELKTAMRFVVRKLSPVDRLSIVAFSGSAAKLCPLRQITKASQPELEEIISRLMDGWSHGPTNIKDGLLTALSVLANRKISDGRVVAIILMSRSKQGIGRASKVTVGNVPVYTFGFGEGSDEHVMSKVAANSMGGTFSHVDGGAAALTMALSQCLAGLLTVAVQNLELTVAAVGGESMIVNVAAGSYPQTQDAAGSVSVSFGNLYSSEVRTVIVDLLLPAIDSERSAEILKVTYSYRSSSSGRQQFVSLLETLTVWRAGVDVLDSEEEKQPVELQREEARLQTAKMIEEVRTVWSDYCVDIPYRKLAEAQNMLAEQSDPLLRTDLQDFLERSDPERNTWRVQGRPYAFSSESSHGRQRFAARGNIEIMRLFATPRMDIYLDQAKKFLRYPTSPLPSTLDDDVKGGVCALTINFFTREEEIRRLSLHAEDPTVPLLSHLRKASS